MIFIIVIKFIIILKNIVKLEKLETNTKKF